MALGRQATAMPVFTKRVMAGAAAVAAGMDAGSTPRATAAAPLDAAASATSVRQGLGARPPKAKRLPPSFVMTAAIETSAKA